MRIAITPSVLFKLCCSKSFSKNIIAPLKSYQAAGIFHPKSSPHATFNLFAYINSKLIHHQPYYFHRATQAFLAPSQTLSPLSLHSDLEEALDSANNTEELLTAFKALEASLNKDDERLGLACLKVGDILHSKASKNLEKALGFAVRALEILGRNDGEGSLPLVKALRLVGSISCRIKRFNESLESLETAYQILGSLEEEGFNGKEFNSERISIQLEFANTKNLMGQRWEALLNLRRALQIRMQILEPDSMELGLACKDVAEACAGVLEFGEALPLCLKALEIFEAKLGENCEEMVQIRQLLGAIHVGLGENEEALTQNEFCRAILLSLNMECELLNIEIEAANIQINLGRFGEAMSNLKAVIQKTGKESEARVLAFVSMAKVLFFQERFGDSKGCLDMSCDILNKLELISSEKVAETFLEISMLYEMMNEFETAISLMKRTLALLEKIPQEQHLLGSVFARMGWLLLFTGRVQHAVPSLESAVTKLKSSFGPKHFGLGFAYKHLGQAYLEMEKIQSAIQMLLLAKDIIEASFGPQHEDSIDTCQHIANAYGVMGSYDMAMEFQQHVIDRWEMHAPDAKDELREAIRLLQQLKKKVAGSPSAVFPAHCLPESLLK
ncbi:hypothetical protein KSP39_PZI015046 [Platanthera zijinensis]|uniref:Uncharacterized protein n=1 Tax=Platanthera zijinensis TaxID=2320716 RepID=A0AAP0BAD6_9ASPA